MKFDRLYLIIIFFFAVVVVSLTSRGTSTTLDNDALTYTTVSLPNGKVFSFARFDRLKKAENGAENIFGGESKEELMRRLYQEAHTFCAWLHEDDTVPPHDTCLNHVVKKVLEIIRNEDEKVDFSRKSAEKTKISRRSRPDSSSSSAHTTTSSPPATGSVAAKYDDENGGRLDTRDVEASTEVRRRGNYGLTARFFEIAERIYAPAFGTERMGPLLYALVRFHRPQRIVEIGYGYTTPFLAQALKDNARDVQAERRPEHPLRNAQILHDRWYDTFEFYEDDVGLTVLDDQSQRDDDFTRRLRGVLNDLDLADLVEVESSMRHADAHELFEPDSLGVVWNDAQWDPEYLKRWWPLLNKDGGLLLLHNVVGNGDSGNRWCMASPRRTMEEIFPDESFEFLTLMEPHKAYQGSVAILRRLDSAKAPKKYGMSWGGRKPGTRMFSNVLDALDRAPPGRSRKEL